MTCDNPKRRGRFACGTRLLCGLGSILPRALLLLTEFLLRRTASRPPQRPRRTSASRSCSKPEKTLPRLDSADIETAAADIPPGVPIVLRPPTRPTSSSPHLPAPAHLSLFPSKDFFLAQERGARLHRTKTANRTRREHAPRQRRGDHLPTLRCAAAASSCLCARPVRAAAVLSGGLSPTTQRSSGARTALRNDPVFLLTLTPHRSPATARNADRIS